jgi:hypothetical protein
MPISVTVTLADGDIVAEMPDDATVLTVKEHISEKYGFPVGEIRLMKLQASKMLKNDYLLSSDPRHAKLKMVVSPIK